MEKINEKVTDLGSRESEIVVLGAASVETMGPRVGIETMGGELAPGISED